MTCGHSDYLIKHVPPRCLTSPGEPWQGRQVTSPLARHCGFPEARTKSLPTQLGVQPNIIGRTGLGKVLGGRAARRSCFFCPQSDLLSDLFRGAGGWRALFVFGRCRLHECTPPTADGLVDNNNTTSLPQLIRARGESWGSLILLISRVAWTWAWKRAGGHAHSCRTHH